MKKINRLLLILHTFVGIGAMGGGMMAILNPQGPGGMPTDALKYTPFKDFLVPGIILFTVIGLGNIICTIGLILHLKFQAYISSTISWALVIWIVVQCIMLRSIVHLHVIFFILGLLQAAFSMIILFRNHLFPSNIIYHIFIKLEQKHPDNIVVEFIGKILKNMYMTDK